MGAIIETLDLIVNALINFFTSLFATLAFLFTSVAEMVAVSAHMPTILLVSFNIFLGIYIFRFIGGK